MAVLTQDIFVRTDQFEIGVFVMIKLDAGPLFIMVTLMAFDTSVAVMDIIQVMAEVTVLRCFQVTFVNVAILATDFLVHIP